MNKRAELLAMLDAVDKLAAQMKKKLRQKAREGYSGGLALINRPVVAEKLQEHVEELTGLPGVQILRRRARQGGQRTPGDRCLQPRHDAVGNRHAQRWR